MCLNQTTNNKASMQLQKAIKLSIQNGKHCSLYTFMGIDHHLAYVNFFFVKSRILVAPNCTLPSCTAENFKTHHYLTERAHLHNVLKLLIHITQSELTYNKEQSVNLFYFHILLFSLPAFLIHAYRV